MESSQDFEKIQVTTNFFKLEKEPIESVSIYSYNFVPEIENDNRVLRMHLLNKAMPMIEERLGLWIKSGNTLYSKIEHLDSISVPIESVDETEYTIVINYAGRVAASNTDSYRMYANSALKRMLESLDLKQVTKLPKYYDTRQTQRLEQHRLDIWRGYSASFSHHLRDMLLNIDFSSKIIRDSTALSAMEEIRSRCTNRSTLAASLNSEMTGKIVMARYGNFKCYKIDEVLLAENPSMEFVTAEGPVSYVEYFKRKYGIQIKNLKQPLIKSCSHKGAVEIRLIPELCFLTGLSPEIRRDYKALNEIAGFTRLQPNQRLAVSVSLAGMLGLDEGCKKISDEYNIVINPTALVIDSYKIQPEVIKVGSREIDNLYFSQDHVFSIKGTMWRPVNIDRWVILYSERDASYIDKVVKTFMSKSSQLGIKLNIPLKQEYNSSIIKELIERISLQGKTQLILIIVGSNEKRLYNETKALTAQQYGIPTQFLKSSNIVNVKKFDSIMTKVLIQIAVKTGSSAWFSDSKIPELPFTTMVVGIDVFHDTVAKAKSVLGFVASIHPNFTSYYNTSRIHQRSGQEIAGHVGECMNEALKAFHQATKNKFYPEVIVVFRDGVANSQISAAQDAEVSSIKSMLLHLYPGYQPKLVYVIVNKKTNAKLFVKGKQGYENPKPGTLVNSMIMPEDNSFYLISHYVKNGIASPTLYRIIDNTEGIDLFTIAKLAFKLCFLYYNWTGGIKVPAPTMMAHKLAFVVGQSVHQAHHENLRLLPWFY